MKFTKFLIIFFILTFIHIFQIKSQNKIKTEILNISVKGLVCDFCARSIEKLFKKENSVEEIDVNLEKMLIMIRLKNGETLNNEKVIRLINDSGYDVQEINRVN